MNILSHFINMRRSLPLARGAKGYGWYHKYLEQGPNAFKKNIPPSAFDWSAPQSPRPRVFFKMGVNDEVLGKLVFELAEDIVPKTVANFIALCKEKDSLKNKYSYKGTKIHMIMKETFIMAGDVVNNDGTGSHSAGSSRFFRDENFIIPHTARGYIRYDNLCI